MNYFCEKQVMEHTYMPPQAAHAPPRPGTQHSHAGKQAMRVQATAIV
jgi:hypothetical protein